MTTPASETSRSKNVLGLIRPIGIVFAGAWTVYLFVRFGDQIKTLEVASNKIEIQIQTLELASKEIEIQKSTLDLATSEIEASMIASAIITPADVIDVVDLTPGAEGEHVFYVTYSFRFENLGMQMVEVTEVVVFSYRASLDFPQTGSHLHVNGIGESGETNWTLLGSKGWMYAPKWNENSTYYQDHDTEKAFIQRGGGTSELHAGEASDGSVEVLISARRNEVVGFKLNVKFNGGTEDVNIWENMRWKLLTAENGENRVEENSENSVETE